MRPGQLPSAGTATCELRVGGMDCASCAATVEKALRRLDGVEDVNVDVVGGRVRVGVAPDRPLGRHELAVAIRGAGYTVEDDTRDRSSEPTASFWQRSGRVALAAAAGVTLALGLLARWVGLAPAVELVLLALSSAAGGWLVVPKALRALRNRALDMNVLMSIAAAGAWLIGEPEEAAATLFLFALAELLESWSMDRARHAIGALMELAPAEATVRRGGHELRVPAAEVLVGETVLVRPGEKLPVDGAVTGGRSSVNEAPITGESMPVDKASGDEVFAGSLNGAGVLEIRSSKPASDTTLARIVHAVEEAQASRAPTQTFVDRFAHVYTPLVVLAATLLAIGPPLLGLGAWGTWIYRALAMLVVACPCALVISTPVSIVSGLAGLARGGVLVKGGAHLENLARVTAVCLDKTGTLTEGRPALAAVVAIDVPDEREVLRLALGVERHSEHPLARAVVEAAATRGIEAPSSDDFESLVGRGARARVDGCAVAVGNERLLAQLGVNAGVALLVLERLEEQGMTAVAVVDGDVAVGVLGVSDRLRENARSALADLRAVGVRRLVMLTGDTEGTARAVAAVVDLDEVHARLLPDDKVRLVRDIESRGEHVAFVGDGVNDAPALAAATVGVAMGAAGTDVALETADVALMADDLARLPFAVRHARRTLAIVRQNVAVALTVKAVFLVLAVSGVATLWMAVAADMGGSLLVVANGLRARDSRLSKAG